jgi:hypothetical protein
MEPDVIIVIGPPRSGKTLNRDAIARAYRCTKVYDAVEYELKIALKSSTERILVLAQEIPPDPTVETRARSQKALAKVPRLPGRVVSIEQAKQMCGDEWIEPKL